MNTLLARHQAVQEIAKAVLAELGPTIGPSDSERTIGERATAMLADHGITDTWYHSCPAFVLLGSRSCLSISGREYIPSEEAVGSFNLVTVDLSPMRDEIWGDCARSFFVEDGACVLNPSHPVFLQGMNAERSLHAEMRNFVTPETTFGDLFEFANSEIKRHGFENLDFLGNVGHSIERQRQARRYIERGNSQMLVEADMFTFEPHIRHPNSSWGFKHENIYYFDDEGRVAEL